MTKLQAVAPAINNMVGLWEGRFSPPKAMTYFLAMMRENQNPANIKFAKKAAITDRKLLSEKAEAIFHL